MWFSGIPCVYTHTLYIVQLGSMTPSISDWWFSLHWCLHVSISQYLHIIFDEHTLFYCNSISSIHYLLHIQGCEFVLTVNDSTRTCLHVDPYIFVGFGFIYQSGFLKKSEEHYSRVLYILLNLDKLCPGQCGSVTFCFWEFNLQFVPALELSLILLSVLIFE